MVARVSGRPSIGAAVPPDPRGPDARAPLYRHVHEALRDKIRAGVWPAHRPLPTEAELAAFYGVSRVTVRKAMGLLEGQGLIWRQRGRGTFVNEAAAERARESNFAGLLENINDFQQVTTVRPIAFRTVAASLDVARRLEIGSGTDVLEIVRVRRRLDGPISHVTCTVTYPEAELLDPAGLGNRPVFAVLEEAGVRVDRVEQGLSAVSAEPVVAERLRVPPGTALIAMWRVVRDRANRPVEFVHSLYRADRYEYRVGLSKHAGPAPPRWVALD